MPPPHHPSHLGHWRLPNPTVQLRWFPPEMPKPLASTGAGAASAAAGAASGDSSSSSSSSSAAAAAPAPKARGKAAKTAAAAASSSASSSSAEGEGDAVEAIDFVDGIKTMCGVGDSMTRAGCAVHIYTCNADMVDTCFQNSDGDMLIVPQVSGGH